MKKQKRVDEVVWVAAYKDGWPFIQSVSFYKRVPQLFIRQSKLDARADMRIARCRLVEVKARGR